MTKYAEQSSAEHEQFVFHPAATQCCQLYKLTCSLSDCDCVSVLNFPVSAFFKLQLYYTIAILFTFHIKS